MPIVILAFITGLGIGYLTGKKVGLYIGLIVLACGSIFLLYSLVMAKGFFGLLIAIVIALFLMVAGISLAVGGYVGYRLGRRRIT